MKKNKNCCLCNSEMNLIWSIKNGVVPNLYLKEIKDEQKSEQNIFFCENCQIIENVHNFSEKELFGNYVYRTPLTSMDDEIAIYLSAFIKENGIKNIIEVAGNNGTFANKILTLLKNENNLKYTIIDKVPLEYKDRRLSHINRFLNKNDFNVNRNVNPELVIVRHALAHNENVVNFFDDIHSILKPRWIYVENASLNSTFSAKDYSQLYSEHFFALSPYFMKRLGMKFNYEITDIHDFKIHNGSFGILLEKNKVSDFQSNYPLITCEELSKSITDWTEEVKNFWLKIKEIDKKIVVWGCSAKFLFTYSALELESIKPISYIIDSTPEKNSLYAPGSSIKVSSEDSFSFDDGFIFVIGARNFSDHIESKILKKFPYANIFCPPF